MRHPADFAAGLDLGVKGMRIGVIRHFWEKDLPVHAELPPALEAAISLFRELGATVEDVALRPLHTYSDVKIVSAESELFSLHLPELIARPEAFGQDFRARSLAACLFTAEDYVRASRERRAILAEMRPLYRQYDLFLTANGSPAPRLDRHDTLSFWKRPNLTTPFNCTGGPALCPAVRLHPGRAAAVDADRRPAVRRCPTAAGGPRLRACERLPQAAPQAHPEAPRPAPSTPSPGCPTPRMSNPPCGRMPRMRRHAPACGSRTASWRSSSPSPLGRSPWPAA